MKTLILLFLLAASAAAQINNGGGGTVPGSNCGDTSHALGWNGAYTCQAVTGSAAAGGSTTQLQYNNATALGGISQFTTNGTTTITGSATSVFDLHAAGVGGLLLPGALATGIVKVTTSTGALTILAAPASTIVGISDTQALTNKDLTGAGNTFPTFNQNTSGTAASATNFSGSLAGDVTGPQGTTVVAKINGNSVTTGAANNQALICTSANSCVWKTLPDCVGSSNALNFTAATNVFTCLSITTLSNPMTTIGDMIGGGASGASTRIVGGKTGQSIVATNGATPAFSSPGLADGNSAAHVTTTPYAIACDSSTAVLDRATTIVFDSGASVVTLPDHTATGCGGSMVFTLVNESGSTLTVNRGGTDTLNITGTQAKSIAATSFTMADSANATINNGEAGIWNARLTGPASGSLSGMTAGQVPIAATATTVTSSEALAGAGAGITTGPTSSTTTDLASFTGTGGQLQDSGIASGNVNTAASAAGAANQIALSNAADKTLKYATADSTTTHALFATAGAPAFRALVTGDLPTAIPLANIATQANATLLSNVSGGSAVPSANALPTTANALIKTSNANGALAASLTTDDGTTSTYTGTGGTKSPVFTGTGTTAGFWDFPQGTTSAAVAPCNVATSICFQAPTAVTSYLTNFPGAAPTVPSFKQTDTCGSAVCTETFQPAPIVLAVTADFVTAANTNLQAITGLTFPGIATKAFKAKVDCDVYYNQQTAAVADAFGIQDVTTAPTEIDASGMVQTAATTWVDSVLNALTTTTATNIVAMTPSAITTVWHAQLHALVDQPSGTASVVQIMVKTGTSADTVTVKRGSSCLVTFQ